MAEEEYEIRGAHEEAIEARAGHHEPLSQKIALFSAILATLGAIVSFLGGHTQNDALYYKNEAVLMKARASDSWSYYQSEDIKRHLAEIAPPALPADAAKYEARARGLRAQAEDYDRRSEEADAESRKALAPHTMLAIAMTFIQIAIALASISALTQRRWLLWGGSAFAVVGLTLSVLAWL